MEVMDITRLRKVNELANTLSRNRLVSNKMEAADLANTLAGRRSEQELKRSVVDKNQFLVHEEQKFSEVKQSPALNLNYCTKEELKDELNNMFNKLLLQQSIENDKLKTSMSETTTAFESSQKKHKELQQELFSVKEQFTSLRSEYTALRDEYNTLWQQLNQAVEESQQIEEETEKVEATESEYNSENATCSEAQEYEPTIVDVSELDELQPETITLNDLQEEQTTYEQLMIDDNNLQQVQNIENLQEELIVEQQKQLQPQAELIEEQANVQEMQEEVQQGYVEQQDFAEQPLAQEFQEQIAEEKNEMPALNDEFILDSKTEQIPQKQEQQVFNVFVNEDLEAAEEQNHEVQRKLFTNGSAAPEPKRAFHHKTGDLTSDDVSVEKMFYYGK
ncbi:hypothetical protein HZA96_06920 [Candidatus Woesearchaeota archaeon]|nr:hypothetical protein [Candidatus Woesearchaeota archaeon]